MTDAKPETTTEKTTPEEKDAILEGGQADYGTAGELAKEGVNGAKPEDAA